MYHLKLQLSLSSIHARRTYVDRRKMYTRDLYGRFKALVSLVLFCLLEIKRKNKNTILIESVSSRTISLLQFTQIQTAPTPQWFLNSCGMTLMACLFSWV